ncbi:MAG TPA: hypothetical protein PKZ53_03925 [Acidobacteriota bacterium]|nr:hypothetical protein [Acidobacteriota bacterium]
MPICLSFDLPHTSLSHKARWKKHSVANLASVSASPVPHRNASQRQFD